MVLIPNQGQPFRQVLQLLPASLRGGLERLEHPEQIEEIRLRCGRPAAVVLPEGERLIPGRADSVTGQEIARTLETATRASAHTALAQVRNGFFTVQGGHRIGLCGTAVLQGGTVSNLREISSLAIRIASQRQGLAAPLLEKLWDRGGLAGTLILSPPGGGKTTLLRELVRVLSDGEGCTPMRVGVADERGEVAAVWEGIPQLNVGARTDVMTGCPKAEALLMLLRGMNPQVLAVDEITAPEDGEALLRAANCGVTLLATAHGTGVNSLQGKRLYRDLIASGAFQRVITIGRQSGERQYCVTDLEGISC